MIRTPRNGARHDAASAALLRAVEQMNADETPAPTADEIRAMRRSVATRRAARRSTEGANR